MNYITDRKRAVGLGSGKTGTEHYWRQQVSGVALLILVPLFLFCAAGAVGETYETVVAIFSRPFPAIVTALTLVVGLNHFRHGAQVAIEDYSDGLTRKLLIIAVICVSYGAIAVGLFALARLAL